MHVCVRVCIYICTRKYYVFIWKEAVVNYFNCRIFQHLYGVNKEIDKNPLQNHLPRRLDLNPGPPEYETNACTLSKHNHMFGYPGRAVLRYLLYVRLVVLQQRENLLQTTPFCSARGRLGELQQEVFELLIPYLLHYKQQHLYTPSRYIIVFKPVLILRGNAIRLRFFSWGEVRLIQLDISATNCPIVLTPDGR